MIGTLPARGLVPGPVEHETDDNNVADALALLMAAEADR